MKRIFALFLCLCLCLTLLPAAAAEDIEIVDAPPDCIALIDEPDAAPGPDAEIQAEVIATGKCGENLTWTVYDDMLLEIDGSDDMYDYDNGSNKTPWYDYRSQITSLLISQYVTHIGDYAFYGCSKLDWSERQGSRMVPWRMKSIGQKAFYGCSKLSYLALDSGLTEIGQQAFANCTGLKRVTICGAGVDGLSIGSRAFSQCTGLEEISFLWNAPDFSSDAFEGSSLAVAYYPPDKSSWTSSVRQDYGGSLIWTAGYHGWCGDEVEWNFDADTRAMSLSGSGETWSNNQNGVPSLGTLNKLRSRALSVSVGEGITTLGDAVFSNYDAMTEISLPGTLLRIDRNAFEYCTALTAVTIPASVTKFGYCAFCECSALKTVRFLGHAPEIASDSFRGVTAVVYYYPVYSWTAGKQQNYGGTLTYDCDNKIGDKVTWFLYGYGTLELFGTGATRDYPVEYPGFYCFRNEIKNVTVGDGVTGLGSWLFYNLGALEKVELGSGLRAIGNYCFRGCGSLREIVFTGDAPSFGSDVFMGVTATAYYPAGEPTWTSDVMQDYGGTITWMCKGQVGDDVWWTLSSDGTLELTGTGPTWSFTSGYPGFYGNKSQIKSLVVGAGVTELGKYLFDYLAVLETAYLGKDVTLVDRFCFRNCSSLRMVRFRGHAPTIGDSAFQGVDAVAIYYPVYSWTEDKMQDYGGTLDWACDYKIGEDVAWQLSSYGSLDLYGSGATWSYPGDYPGFYNFREECTSAYCYDGVTELGNYLFYGMVMLNRVRLPESLTKIGQMAFAECSALSMDFKGDAPELGYKIFYGTDVVLASYPAKGAGWASAAADAQGAEHMVWAANYAGSKVWTYLDSFDPGAVSLGFTVESGDGKALLVAMKLGEEYTPRDCTVNGGYHTFTLALRDGVNYLAIALKGDVDLNGKVESRDGNMASRASVGRYTISDPLVRLVADIDGNGKIESRDGNMISRASVNKYTIPW